MIIAVRSEMDSRPFVYPLIRVLKDYGSVCFITSNRVCNRLLSAEDKGGFRNIRVIVDEDGATDEVLSSNGITSEDYDFIILDNMGITTYDVLMVPLGEFVSEEFQSEIELLKQDALVRFIQFGGSKKKQRPERQTRTRHRGKGSEEEETEVRPEDKFSLEESTDEEYNVAERYHHVAWPTWAEIEEFESLKRYMKPESGLLSVIYKEFKQYIAIDERSFMKSMSSAETVVLGATDVVEADIDSNPKKRKAKR